MSNVSNVGSNYTDAYSNYSATAKQSVAEAAPKKDDATAVTFKASAEGRAAASKMSETDRANLVAKMKSDLEAQTSQLMSIVYEMFEKQGKTIGLADDMWKLLAKGDFEVDPVTKAKAQEDISEDGYWGVKQTSERIFDFAMALSGGDQEKMEKMRNAFEKGFKQATATWGQDLPSISKDTYDAVHKLFDDYAKSFETEESEA